MFSRLPHNWQVFLLALLTGAPAVGATLYLLWRPVPTAWLRWALLLVMGAAWIGFGLMVRARGVGTVTTGLRGPGGAPVTPPSFGRTREHK